MCKIDLFSLAIDVMGLHVLLRLYRFARRIGSSSLDSWLDNSRANSAFGNNIYARRGPALQARCAGKYDRLVASEPLNN